MNAWLSFLWRWTRRLVVVALFLGVIAAAVSAVLYKQHVVDDPGAHIDRAAIMEIIAQESPVLYADGQTRIGVFFAQEHRDYVPYDHIPQAWVDAITSSEDRRFFSHYGVDPKGIARAMRDNFVAGHVVAGGSTLTQQTAKNLYYRPDRSLRSKWEELLNALRLEAHFSKQDILEFYANQFHVSANGRGLGIAARYFFDKNVEDLDTLECAFLAGMVKAPATYNPFLGNSPTRQAEARARATERTRHVLDRMLANGKLSKSDHAALMKRELPFARGTFRYDTNVVLDEVAARLEQAPFPAIFSDLGIDNPSTAGIQVVTTIDRSAQRGATYALWHHLTEVGPLLEGEADDWKGAAAFRLAESAAPKHDPHALPERWDFRNGVVTASAGGDAPSMVLDLGGHDCLVDGDGIKRAATVIRRAARGESGGRASVADIDKLVDALAPGSVVWVSVRQGALGDTKAQCDLELRPQLQGAVMVLEDGQIRAMVGGNDNRNFNRAVTAGRQLGSTWKPVLYFAALQLGWVPTDSLDNREGQAFPFEGSWYYPRPDHHSEHFVSLGWAGTRSENVASIWLLAHLIDRLDDDQLRQLAASVDLVQRPGEERSAWIARIRDDWGVISTKSRLPELAFVAARADMVAELRAAGDLTQARDVVALTYGRGAQAQAKKLAAQRGSSQKLASVRFNLLRLGVLSDHCVAQAAALQSAMEGGPVPAPDQVKDLRLKPAGGSLQLGCGDTGEGWADVGEHLLGAVADGVKIPLGSPDQMWVEGRLTRGTLLALRRATARRTVVLGQADLWGLDVLLLHPDYRLLLGMRYVALLARRLGVTQDLPPVLSLPLGAVDISLDQAAGLYQGMLAGQAWRFPGQVFRPGRMSGTTRVDPVVAPEASQLLIAEIRDRTGALLYRAQPQSIDLTDPAVGRQTGDILRNVVRWGTGRRANGRITLGGQPVPVAGKTGTTNSYRNAAFIGFVPRVTPGPEGPVWRWGEGFTVAVYVGYDDNRSMRRGRVRLQGASGALPAWIGTAQALADGGLLGGLTGPVAADGTPPAALPASNEWELGDGFRRIAVSKGTGLPVGLPRGDPRDPRDPGDAGDADDPSDETSASVAPAPVDLSERSIVVARTHGLLGYNDELRRVVAMVGPPREGALAAAGGVVVIPAEPVPSVQVPVTAPIEPAPDAAAPDAAAPDAAAPDAAAPDAAAPDAADDAIEQWLGSELDDPSISPDSVSPDSVSPDSVSPDSVSPDSVSPDSVSPDSVNPGSDGPAGGAPEGAPEEASDSGSIDPFIGPDSQGQPVGAHGVP